MTYHQSRMSLRAQLIESLCMPLPWHFPQSYPDHQEPALKSALKLKPAHTQPERLNKALVATQLNSSTSTAHKRTPRVHTLLATACN